MERAKIDVIHEAPYILDEPTHFLWALNGPFTFTTTDNAIRI